MLIILVHEPNFYALREFSLFVFSFILLVLSFHWTVIPEIIRSLYFMPTPFPWVPSILPPYSLCLLLSLWVRYQSSLH